MAGTAMIAGLRRCWRCICNAIQVPRVIALVLIYSVLAVPGIDGGPVRAGMGPVTL